MNAPVNLPQQRPVRIDETVAERAHRHSITTHCANQDEVEMAARVDLAMLRDQATAGMSRATDSAAVILGEVVRMATGAVFAQLPASRLMMIRSALNLTMEAARMIDRLERG